MRPFLLVAAALPFLGACFWGESDSHVWIAVSSANVDAWEGLVVPADRSEAWTSIFASRAPSCPDPDPEGGCAEATERTDLVDLYVRHRTDRVRGLITQKGDLQITSHMSVGDAFERMAGKEWSQLDYLLEAGEEFARGGTGCGADSGEQRKGVGRCLREEIVGNEDAYLRLDEDLRLVFLVNLPGEDDVRSSGCDSAPSGFEGDDWDYPKTLRVNYDAREPVELEDGRLVYGDPDVDRPLARCSIEVFSMVQIGTETFAGDWYGQGGEPGEYTLDLVNEPCDPDGECPDPLLGTLEMEELVMPGEGDARARGRFNVSFTSDSFSARDGLIHVIGDFDTEVRVDRAGLDEPDRQLDLDDAGGA